MAGAGGPTASPSKLVLFGSPEFRAKAAPAVDKTIENPWKWLEPLYEYLGASKEPTANARNRAHYYKCLSCEQKFTGYASTTNGLRKHQLTQHKVSDNAWKQLKVDHRASQQQGSTASQQQQPEASSSGQGALQVDVSTVTSSSGRTGPGRSNTSGLGSPTYPQATAAGPMGRYVNYPGRLNDILMRLIVNHALPFSFIEYPELVEAIALLSPQTSLYSRRQVSDKLQDMFTHEKDRLRLALTEVQHVALTADVWTGPNVHGYLGMTVHWLSEATLQRKSAMLCCRRLVGKHDYAVLEKVMTSVIAEFGIQGKVVRITTDNGSNFRKAFRYVCSLQHHISLSYLRAVHFYPGGQIK